MYSIVNSKLSEKEKNMSMQKKGKGWRACKIPQPSALLLHLDGPFNEESLTCAKIISMKNLFSPGDIKTFTRTVRSEDVATFDSGEVHPVYATFCIARDAEWVCRLFVLDMKDEDEEGIGTYISVNHLSSALVGEEVTFEAVVQKIEKNEVVCTYKATCGARRIAEGENKQKILKKERLEMIFSQINT